MTQEEKDLLLKDLCARLPYKVKVCDDMKRIYTLTLGTSYLIDLFYDNGDYVDVPITPYLRPMSSMTEEEYNEVGDLLKAEDPNLKLDEVMATIEIDWLNAHHFDYRGLIDKGLAIEVTEENNPYESTSETY